MSNLTGRMKETWTILMPIFGTFFFIGLPIIFLIGCLKYGNPIISCAERLTTSAEDKVSEVRIDETSGIAYVIGKIEDLDSSVSTSKFRCIFPFIENKFQLDSGESDTVEIDNKDIVIVNDDGNAEIEINNHEDIESSTDSKKKLEIESGEFAIVEIGDTCGMMIRNEGQHTYVETRR